MKFSRKTGILTARYLFVIYILSAFLFSSSDAAQDTMKLHFINVGYGDAILVELPSGENILIDAGSAQDADSLTRYLDAQNVESLKAVILTHPHENHFGGIPSVLRKWSVERIYSNNDVKQAEEGYEDVVKIIGEKHVPQAALKEGDSLSWGGEEVTFSVLHPADLSGTVNENGLVIQIVYQETSFLLTSDIQPVQQKALIERYPQVKKAHVVQVPHHGGKIDTQFAQSFDRAVFVVSTGINKYGKPFMDELNKFLGQLLRTDQKGTIVFQSDGHYVKVVSERD